MRESVRYDELLVRRYFTDKQNNRNDIHEH